MKNPAIRATLYAVLVGFVALLFFHGGLLFHPGNVFFGNSGDGLKNYYTFAYHVQHDDDALHFEGMNYPYGEHIIYTDAQPAISIPTQFLAKVLPSLGGKAIALANLLMLLDLVFCIVLLTHIFRHFKVHLVVSLVAALGIALLSPQVFRMASHYGLSFSFFLPLVWLLALKLLSAERPLRWALAIALTIFTLYWIHPYLGLMSAGFACLYGVLEVIAALIQKRRLWWKSAWLILSGLLSTVLFRGIVALSDKNGLRANDPGGVREYLSSWDSVLHPVSGISDMFMSTLVPSIPGHWEGIAYLGGGIIIGALILLVYLIYKPAQQVFKPLVSGKLVPPLIAAFILLFFSFGWHLDIPWLENSPLAQFRSLGRFAWPCYYVLAVTMVVWLFRASTDFLKNPVLRWATVLVVPLLFCHEGAAYRKHIAKQMVQNENVWTPKALEVRWGGFAQEHDISTFNACIPIPYFHNGSGRIMIEGKNKNKANAYSLSLYTGLPLIAAEMARTSYVEAKEIVQATGHAPYTSALAGILAPTNRLLVMKNGSFTSAAQKALVDRSQHLGRYGEVEFYSITAEELFADPTDALIQKLDALYPEPWHRDGRLLHAPEHYVHCDDMEWNALDTAMFEKGGLVGKMNSFTTLLADKAQNLNLGEPYVYSFWSDRGSDLLNAGMVVVERKEGDDGATSWEPMTDIRASVTYKGNWAMLEVVFTPKSTREQFKLVFKGKDGAEGKILFDEALLRPLDSDVFSVLVTKGDTQLMHNGMIYDLPKGALSLPAAINPADTQ